MKINPIRFGSQWVYQYAHLAKLRRLGKLASLGSLLAYRLRRKKLTRLYCDHPPAKPEAPRDTGKPDDNKPVDRTWPSDLPIKEDAKNVETTRPARLQSPAGGLLDLWS